jgi:PPP family 3-phenylpropionic acid transporter
LLALGTWAKAATNPGFGRLADASRRPRLVLAGMAAVVLAGSTAFHGAAGFWPLLAVYLLVFPIFQALIPVGDSRALVVASARGLDYGRMRLWGSLAFLLAVLGVGELLDVASPDTIPWLLSGAFALVLLTAAALPAASEREAARAEDGRRRGLRTLLREPWFLVFLATGALLQASHAVYYAFSAVHWTAAGLSPSTVGWLWAEGVIAEILLFSVSGRVLARIGPLGLLGAAALGGLVRWTVLAGTTALPALILVQGLHAATFGAAHLGAVHFITRHAPRDLQASAQGLSSAAAGGVGMGLAMLVAGTLYERTGGAAFLAMTAMCAAAGVLTLVLARRPRFRWTGA